MLTLGKLDSFVTAPSPGCTLAISYRSLIARLFKEILETT